MNNRALSHLVVAMLLGANPVLAADRPMTAAEFDAYTLGKTLYYGTNGLNYGIEEYLDGRRVRWSFLGDECIDGIWYAEGSDICFVYEGRDGVQCWQFFFQNGRLTAKVSGDVDGSNVYEVHQSPEPMQCLGPRIGV